MVILSDLLYFDASHPQLVASIVLLLRRSNTSRAYVAAGTYTPPAVCARFLQLAQEAGFEYEENTGSLGEGNEDSWPGNLPVIGLTKQELALRKAQVRLWTLWWSDKERS